MKKEIINSLLETESISVSEESLRLLKDDISKSFKNYPLLRQKVMSEIKDKDTFDNSLAEIYNFLKDSEYCLLNCPKSFSNCKKDNPGFVYELKYDKYLNKLVNTKQTCSYRNQFEKMMLNINPCDLPNVEFLNIVNHNIDLINTKNLKDCHRLISQAVKNSASYNEKNPPKGYLLKTDNEKNLIEDLLCSIAFIYAKNNFAVSYVHTNNLFVGLLSKDIAIKDEAIADFNKCLMSTVLCLDKLDILPYMDSDKSKSYLYKLIKERNQKGKITYCTLQDVSNSRQILAKYFKNTDYYEEAVSNFDSLFEIKDIGDMIL